MQTRRLLGTQGPAAPELHQRRHVIALGSVTQRAFVLRVFSSRGNMLQIRFAWTSWFFLQTPVLVSGPGPGNLNVRFL